MRLRCAHCGKSVSTEVPDKTVIRAWIVCPECIGNTDQVVQEHLREIEKSKKAIDESHERFNKLHKNIMKGLLS